MKDGKNEGHWLKWKMMGCGHRETIYGIGGIGALIFFIGQDASFTGIIIAILKSIVWPAFLVYELFSFIS